MQLDRFLISPLPSKINKWIRMWAAICDYYKSRDTPWVQITNRGGISWFLSYLNSLNYSVFCPQFLVRYGQSERSDIGSEDDVSGGVFGAQIWALEWPCFRVDWWCSSMGREGQIFFFSTVYLFLFFFKKINLFRRFSRRVSLYLILECDIQ